VFEKLRETLDALLDAGTPADHHGVVSKMHEAVVETRAAIHGLRDDLQESETKLAREQSSLADAERRGGMARDIGDSETADIADQYADKHRERVDVLERKVIAQRHEIELAERELDEMKVQMLQAKARGGATAGSVDDAMRSIDDITGSSDSNDALRRQLNRAEREAAAEDKLEEMKRKMGR
jgi:hypothetical protein